MGDISIWKIIVALSVVVLGAFALHKWRRDRATTRALTADLPAIPGDVVMPTQTKRARAIAAPPPPLPVQDVPNEAAPRIELSAIWKPTAREDLAPAPLADAHHNAPPASFSAPAALSPPAPPAPAVAPPAPQARLIPPRAACFLGAHFLRHLLDNRAWLPGGRALYTEEEACAALAQLEVNSASATLPHGAVVCRVNPRCALLIDPLLSHVEDEPRTIAALQRATADAQVFVILGQLTDDLPPGEPPRDAHVTAVLKALDVPPAHLFYAIEDGSYHSYPEVDAHFIPCRIDHDTVPGRFVDKMLSYCLERLQDHEPEACLRVLGPLVETLYDRTQREVGGFDALLLARVLNAQGLSNRDMGMLSEAITCFSHAVELARPIGSPDDLHILHKNLADVLIAHAPSTDNPDAFLSAATDQLHHVTRIAEDDLEAALDLGCTYIDRYHCTHKRTMLKRATSVLSHALNRSPNEPAILEALHTATALLADHDQRQRDADAEFKPQTQPQAPEWAVPPRLNLPPRNQNAAPPPQAQQRQPAQVHQHASEPRRRPTPSASAPTDSPADPSGEIGTPRRASAGGRRPA